MKQLTQNQFKWLVTGCAGFIGAHLIETLLNAGQTVTGLDNFSTGFQHNLDQGRDSVSEENWNRFEFIEGDIRNFDTCARAALGSVPRFIEDPRKTNENNITGS